MQDNVVEREYFVLWIDFKRNYTAKVQIIK